MSIPPVLRRWFALLVLFAVVAPVAALPTSASAAVSAPPAVPAAGAYFGASASVRAGESGESAIARTETQIGRKLAIDHQFYKWDQTLPTPHQAWDVAGGRIPFMSWKPQRKDGSAVAWTRIRGGAEDAWITAQADRVRAFGHPVFMVFNHEPYDQSRRGSGTPADFVAAWRRIVDIFRARGATNVAWALVLTGYDYAVPGRADAFYPGDAYVDWIAADPYNFFTRDGAWRDLGEVTSAFYDWGATKGKPLMLAEWGCEEDTPGRKAGWFTNAHAWLATHPAIKAVVYFNNTHLYEWSIDTSASSRAAFTAMGADPWFNPSVLVPAPPATGIVGELASLIPTVPGLAPVGGGTGSGASADAGAKADAGYWMVGADGRVFPFGAAAALGEPAGQLGTATAVDLEPTPGGGGYWIADDGGRVYAYGAATHHGNLASGALAAGERITSLSGSATGAGYTLFTTRGRVFAFGDAPDLGDLRGTTLGGPVLDSITTPSGAGYYMVAADGGVFAFGDARFAGSMGGTPLNAPVESMVPDPDGRGYWLVAADGGVFAFDAPFRGSMGGTRLNQPVTGMVPYGDGYLMAARDGGIFNFSTDPFAGSLAHQPPAHPITAVAATR